MARTPEGEALTRVHRQRQLAVKAAVVRDVTRLWRGVDPTNLAGTIGPFAEASAVVVRARHRDSVSVASRYFRNFRQVEDISGLLPAPRPVQPPPLPVAAEVSRGASLAGIINARKRGFSPQAAARNGLVKVAGAASGLTMAGGRETLIGFLAEDDQALGWQRVTAADPCAFCAMIASRGAVFSASSADFESHDHCSCTPEPFYEGSRTLSRNDRFRMLWDEVQREVPFERADDNTRMNAFRRVYERGRAAL